MIPNIYHFVFGLRTQNEPFHLMYYLCLASCININKPDAVHFHYHHEPYGEWWERIKPKLVLRHISLNETIANYQYVDPVLNQYRYAHLADFERQRILMNEGGIYADIDTLFLKPIPKKWHEKDFILGQEKPSNGATGSLCNAWIASAPGAEFGRLWVDNMMQAFDGTWSNHSTILPYKLWQQHPTLIDVQPESAFYALDYTRKGIESLFLRKVSLPKEAYSLHLWNHLWFARNRLDFSHFNSDLLNVDYVCHANTTYAHFARPHLPDDVKGSEDTYRKQMALFFLRYPLRSIRTWVDGLGSH